MKSIAALIICVCTILPSCISNRYIDIQVLNPAAITLPSDLTNLYIIESLKPTEQSNLSNIKTRYPRLNYYNQLTSSFNLNLKKNLEESPLLQHTAISIKKAKEVLKETLNLPNQLKEKQMAIFPGLGLVIDTSHLHVYSNEYGYAYIVFSLFKIDISNLQANTILDTHQFQDTLIWEIQNYSDLRQLPKEAIYEIGKIAAKKYADHIAPYWTTEERQLLYSNNSLMRGGYNKFVTNDYEGAKAVWEKLYETGTRRLAAKSAFNIALVCELLDDLDQSEEWLKRSIKSMQYIEAVSYLNIIEKRKTIRPALKRQIK
jgi:hypothetical protein